MNKLYLHYNSWTIWCTFIKLTTNMHNGGGKNSIQQWSPWGLSNFLKKCAIQNFDPGHSMQHACIVMPCLPIWACLIITNCMLCHIFVMEWNIYTNLYSHDLKNILENIVCEFSAIFSRIFWFLDFRIFFFENWHQIQQEWPWPWFQYLESSSFNFEPCLHNNASTNWSTSTKLTPNLQNGNRQNSIQYEWTWWWIKTFSD